MLFIKQITKTSKYNLKEKTEEFQVEFEGLGI